MNNTKGFNTVATVVVIGIIVVVAGLYFNAQKEEPSDSAGMMEDDKMMEENGSTHKEDSMMEDDDKMMGEEDKMMEDNDSMMEDDDSMMKKEGETMMETDPLTFSGAVLAGSTSKLLDFNKPDYDKAIASDKLVALYFYASWCPICKKETKDSLYPVFNELNDSNVIGFRVNYNDNDTDDNEKELAREFGVAYQHTKVFVKNGERVLKSPESWNKQRYFDEIEGAL